MAAASTDVRDWLRQQGHEVGTRGAISRDLLDEYEAAHQAPAGAVVAGEVVADDDYPDVTVAADPAPAAARTDDPPPGRRAAERPTDERRPRTVKPSRRRGRGRGGWLSRLFGAGGRKRRAPGPRAPLGDWAEETWLDLAWLAEPIPPLAKILTVQAPYAGVVFDGHVQGTPVDALLQPLARYSGVWRALNGLMGPPVCVLAICATGGYLLDEGQRPVIDGRGRPVPDARTRMLFQLLRYSLLQMAKTSDVSADEISERTEAMAGRMAVVDAIIDDLFFARPGPGPAPGPAAGPPGGAAADGAPAGNGYRYDYPAPPVMDGTGTDPGRL